jgi:hypothetical protein
MNGRFQAMKQINPLAVHSTGLYQISELQAQATRDKLALATKQRNPETNPPARIHRGWWRLRLNSVSLRKPAQIKGQGLLGRLK